MPRRSRGSATLTVSQGKHSFEHRRVRKVQTHEQWVRSQVGEAVLAEPLKRLNQRVWIAQRFRSEAIGLEFMLPTPEINENAPQHCRRPDQDQIQCQPDVIRGRGHAKSCEKFRTRDAEGRAEKKQKQAKLSKD